MNCIRVSIILWRVAFIPPIGDMMVGLKSKLGSDSIDALRSSAHPTRAELDLIQIGKIKNL
jgi:hypothetical protein